MFEYTNGGKYWELGPKGASRKVTETNKKEYCDLLALTQMQSLAPMAKLFVNGFYTVCSPGAVVANSL